MKLNLLVNMTVRPSLLDGLNQDIETTTRDLMGNNYRLNLRTGCFVSAIFFDLHCKLDLRARNGFVDAKVSEGW